MMRVVITLEGGMIRGISTNDPEFAEDYEVVVADYDTEGAGSTELYVDPRTPNAPENYFCMEYPLVKMDNELVDAIFNAKTEAEMFPSPDDQDVDGVQERIGIADNDGHIIGGDL